MINPVTWAVRAFMTGGIKELVYETRIIHYSRSERRCKKSKVGWIAKNARKELRAKKKIHLAAVLLVNENERESEKTKETIRSLVSLKGVTVYLHMATGENEKEIISNAMAVINDLREPFFFFVLPGDDFDPMFGAMAAGLIRNDRDIRFIYTDEICEDREICKPAYSPHTLVGHNYIGHSAIISSEMTSHIGIRPVSLSLFIWELYRSVTRRLMPMNIKNIPSPLVETGLSYKQEFFENTNPSPCFLSLRKPFASIIIPSKDNPVCLERLFKSMSFHEAGVPYEIIVVDNGSSEENKEKINILCMDAMAKYLYKKETFNFSKMCNRGRAEAKGGFLLFLNDDTEILTDNWLFILCETAALKRSGAIGAKLLYPNGRIQHVGIVGGVYPTHVLNKEEDSDPVELKTTLPYNYMAVTGACLCLKTERFDAAGGFDESFDTDYNDVVMCVKLRAMGFFNAVRNDVVLTHYESYSRGIPDTPEKEKKLESDRKRLEAIIKKNKV